MQHAGDCKEYSIGQVVVHPTRGSGKIVSVDAAVDKFCVVQFENGEKHSYRQTVSSNLSNLSNLSKLKNHYY